jgi:hypothetical protein
MLQENVRLVQRIYENLNNAYKTGDCMQPIEDFCHPDVVRPARRRRASRGRGARAAARPTRPECPLGRG